MKLSQSRETEFSGYSIPTYLKAGTVFALTTATYFLARTTGILPSWLQWGSDKQDEALTTIDTTEKVIAEIVDEPTSISSVDFSVSESPIFQDKLTDFTEQTLMPVLSGQRKLLQQSPVTVVNPIPDQVADSIFLYQYSLNNVFSGNYELLRAVETGKSSLPDWLHLEYELIGSYDTPGEAGKVIVQGQIAYVADGPAGLQLINISDPTKPKRVGSYDTPGYARDVVVQKNIAFIADWNAGLQIINVTNPTNPVNISSFATPGAAVSIAVQNNVAFVVVQSSLQIINIQNLNNPILISTINTPAPGGNEGISIQNNIVFIAGGSGIQMFNISNLMNPIAISICCAVAYPPHVAVQGNIIFVMHDTAGLSLYNITNIVSPQLISRYDTPGSANYVLVQGGFAFVTDSAAGFHVVDISNPTNPVLVGSTDTPGASGGLAVQNNYVFIADHYSGLQIVDLTRAQLKGIPTLSNAGKQLSITVSAATTNTTLAADSFLLTIDQFPHRIDTTATDQSIRPGETRTLLFDSNLLFTHADTAFIKLSVSFDGGQSMPLWLDWAMQPVLRGVFPCYAENLAIRNEIVLLMGAGKICIVDANDADHPILLSSYIGYSLSADIVDNLVFATDVVLSSLQVINITDLLNPMLVVSYPMLGITGDLVVKNSIAFIATHTAGLQIVNVTVPTNPRLIGNYTMSGPIRGLIVRGNYAFLSIAFYGLRILNITDLTNPVLVGSCFLGNDPWKTAVQDEFAFVVNSGGGLQIVNISHLENPTRISGFGFGVSYGYDVAVESNIVFMVNQYFGLQIIDVSNPIYPVLIGVYTLSGTASGIAIQGNIVYLAGRSAGLHILDVSKWVLTLKPTINDVGNYPMVLTATDNAGGSSFNAFTIRVEGPPRVNGTIAQRYAKVGQMFNYFIPPGVFSDPNLDVISFDARFTDQSGLPSWLGFNALAASFTGTPQNSDKGNFTILLTASDNIAGSVNITFGLYVDHVPVANQPIGQQVAGIGRAYQLVIPDSAFIELDSDPLTFSAQHSNGLPLPTWLSFQNTARLFTGTPDTTQVGVYDLAVIATDPYGGSAASYFSLAVEYFPQAVGNVSAPLAGVDQLWTFTISNQVFTDADDSVLIYSASHSNGAALPGWLSFNPVSLTFSGVPLASEVGDLALRIKATDRWGASAQQDFNVTVTHFPKVVKLIPLQLINVNSSYLYTLPADTFSQEDKAVLSYALQSKSESLLPDWLRFNATSRQLSGRPNATVAGRYELEMVATSPVGAKTSADFSLVVEYFPEILQQIISPLADINSAFSFTLPANSFIDRDGEPLTYTAQRKGGASLPNWLTFNPQSLIFSGVPLETDKGALPLQLIATDLVGATATHNLTIQVVHFPMIAHPEPPMTLRAGRPFHFSLDKNIFTDTDQVGLSYVIAQPLPGWLTFDNKTLSFSGQTSFTGPVLLTLVATDTRGAQVSMDFQLVMRGNVPPTALSGSLSNQAATVRQVFSYFLPSPLFADSHNNTLRYSALQQDGSPLPEWLSFDNRTLHFLGTPGHGDTNFYATRTVGVKVMAQSNEGQASTTFNIIVGGVSWGQLAISIGAPLLSVLTTLYALYQYRAILFNCWNRNRYTRLKNESRDTIRIGEPFEYRLDDTKSELKKIRRVYAGIPDPKCCCRFFRADTRPLPSGESLPRWMEYDEDKNILRSKGNVPEGIQYTQLVIKAEGEAGVILEKFTLDIEEKSHSVDIEMKEDKRVTGTDKNKKEEGVELASLNEGETQTAGIEATTFLSPSANQVSSARELKEAKKESLSSHTYVPGVAKDSPLLKGRTTTSSIMLGEAGKKSSTTRKEAESADKQVLRGCC